MTAIPQGARTTLAAMRRQKIIKTQMDENMQRLLSECETNQKRAALWRKNPMTGKKVIAAKYNDRLKG